MLATNSLTVFYVCVFPMWFLASAALGGAAGTIVNIVPAATRATATASFFLFATIVGLALGPYAAGRISNSFGSLRIGLAGILVVVPFALIALEVAPAVWLEEGPTMTGPMMSRMETMAGS